MRLFRRLTAIMLVLLLLAGAAQISAMAAGYATLRIGDTGSEVERMQAALIKHNYLAGAADGTFGPKTLEAVRSFQRGNGLTDDGLAGNRTLTALYGLSGAGGNVPESTDGTGGSTSESANGTLALGSSGSAVLSMQKALTGLGFSTGGTDGKFGNNTLRAVAAFQRANGLTADGRAGAATLAKLHALAGNGGDAGNDPVVPEPPAALSRTLRPGFTGSDVSLLQTKLAALDYPLDVSGTYDSRTAAAVKAFQSRNSLMADGIAGANTFRVLLSGSAVRAGTAPDPVIPPATYVTLRSGASGEAVRALQAQLASLDYSVDITGSYDSRTVQAVRSFQSVNRISVDGVAGVRTQTLAYSGSALKYSAQSAGYSAPSAGQVRLMHWFNEVKPALRGASSVYVYDPASGNGFTLHLYSLGNHADVEPMTARDTETMMAAFGGKATWTPRFVYVRLPGGAWTAATMHNVAHGGQSITDNNFNGQNCVHFLRDMDEVTRNDPDYGLTNQLALRKGWQNLTGETVE